MVVLVVALAAFNCLYVPLALERTILKHPRTPIELSRLPAIIPDVHEYFKPSLPQTGIDSALYGERVVSSYSCLTP